MTVIKLPRVFGGATMRTMPPYKYEDGEKTKAPVMNLETLAKYCEQAHADLQIHRTVLADAENHVVQCQGEVAKAELFLEECQDEYIKAAKARAGVPT